MKRFYYSSILKVDEAYNEAILQRKKDRAKVLVKAHVSERFPHLLKDEFGLKDLSNYLQVVICPI